MFLKPLLMWHGRENYRRNCYMAYYFFFKNFTFVLPMYFFGFFSRWSSQSFYEVFFLQLFNLVFTSFPIISYAVFDQEHSKEKLLTFPQLYAPGQSNKNLNFGTFFTCFLYSSVISCFIFFTCYCCMADSTDPSGKQSFIWLDGLTCYVAVVCFVTFKILMDFNSHVTFTLVMIVLSCLSIFPALFVLSELEFSPVYKDAANLMSFPQFWLTIFAATFFSLPLEYLHTYLVKGDDEFPE